VRLQCKFNAISKAEVSTISTTLQTSTSLNVAWESTVILTWQTTVSYSKHGQQQPEKRDHQLCCDVSLEHRPLESKCRLHLVSMTAAQFILSARYTGAVPLRHRKTREPTWKWFVPEPESRGVLGVVASRGNNLKIYQDHVHYNLRKYFFANSYLYLE